MKKTMATTIISIVAILILATAGLTVFAAATPTDTTQSTQGAPGEGTAPPADAPPGAPGMQNKAFCAKGADILEIAAAVLGKTKEDIMSAEQAGTTLGEQLKAANKLDAFKTAFLKQLKTNLDAAVKQGSMTQAQADEMYANEQSRIKAWDGSAQMFGMGGHGERGEQGKGGMHVDALDVAAQVLGKTKEDIMSAEQAGTTLGEQLKTANKLDAFKTAFLKQLKTNLDAAVKQGSMTQAQADEMYANEQSKIKAWDGSTQMFGRGGHGERGEQGKGGMYVDALDVAAQVLGKTKEDIMSAEKEGTTLGEQLKAANKLDAFKTAFLKQLKTNLDAAVKQGSMTQAQADEMYTNKQSKIKDWDGSTQLFGMGGHKGGGRCRGFGQEKSQNESASGTANPGDTTAAAA